MKKTASNSNKTRDGLTAAVSYPMRNSDGTARNDGADLHAAICPASGQLVMWTNGDAIWSDAVAGDFAGLPESYGTTTADIIAACHAATKRTRAAATKRAAAAAAISRYGYAPHDAAECNLCRRMARDGSHYWDAETRRFFGAVYHHAVTTPSGLFVVMLDSVKRPRSDDPRQYRVRIVHGAHIIDVAADGMPAAGFDDGAEYYSKALAEKLLEKCIARASEWETSLIETLTARDVSSARHALRAARERAALLVPYARKQAKANGKGKAKGK